MAENVILSTTLANVKRTAKLIEGNGNPTTISNPSIWFDVCGVSLGFNKEHMTVIDLEANEVVVPLSELVAYALLEGTPNPQEPKEE